MAEQDVSPAAPSEGAAHTAESAVPQFALDAADRQLEKIGGSLSGVADSIDGLFEGAALPGGESVQHLAGDASRRLRDLSERANDLDAEELIGDAQRIAAARPALTVAVGAMAGALLAVAFMRAAPKKPTGPADR